MSISSFIKGVQNIMRMDSGVDGDAQRINQLTWMLFLKIFDTKEQEEWAFEDDYEEKGPFVEEKYQWSNWAGMRKADRMSSDDLIEFLVEMFRDLKNMEVGENTDRRRILVRDVFEDSNNYMKSGVLLWQVIDKINEIDFGDYKERHAFNDIYEKILKDLQSAGNAGEYYTPRAVTDFIVNRLNPQIGERTADFACGTGGFLISTLEYLKKNNENRTTEESELIKTSVFGIEKKPMPHLLACTNMILHDIDFPDILHENSLSTEVRDYKEENKFEVIAMNPPFGGTEEEGIKMNFPAEFRTSETADLFMTLIMNRIKSGGRVGLVLPDGFLFGNDNAKLNLKKKLLSDFNLHTIIRLPHSVFAPYTSINTNILFFDNTGSTKETWIYRLDMPEGYKNFSKTKPMQFKHFEPVIKWWEDRKDIDVDGYPKAKKYTPEELESLGYNLDLCSVPNIEEEILDPLETIEKYNARRTELNTKIDSVLKEITDIIGGN